MSKKIYPLLAIVVLVALTLAACGGTGGAGAGETGGEETGEGEVFRVGYVTDTGGINDNSFNETQYAGVLSAAEEVPAIQAQYIQSDEATQYEANLTEFASQGYDLVIAAGLFLGDATAKVAAQYPDIHFVIYDFSYPNPVWVTEGTIGYSECVANVRGTEFKTDQAAFLAGYLAAGMTTTGKVGFFGGDKIPTVTIFGVGFQSGIEYYNSVKGTNIELLGWDSTTGEGLFTMDFVDLTKGREMTVTLFDQGADIFMPVGGLIGTPGFDIARERGGYGIWVDTDGYYSVAGSQDVILTSVMKMMDTTMHDVVIDAYNGKFEGCSYYVGDLANGGVDIAPYHDLDSQVPDDLKAEIDDLKAKIISGEISDTGCASYPEWCPTFYFAEE